MGKLNLIEGGRSCRTSPLERVERHYSVAQVAERLTYSDDKVRRLFENEPGVLKIGNPSRRMGRALKRRYYTLRIPESVVIRVLARYRNR